MGDLQLNLITRADVEDIIIMLDEPEVCEYLFFAPAPRSVYEEYFGPIVDLTEEALREQRWPDNPVLIIRDSQQAFVGMVGIVGVMFQQGTYEVGYQMPTRSWGKGIATAGCQLASRIIFTELGGHKAVADCFAGNIGSYRVMEKSGYRREGIQKDYFRHGEGFDDRLLYGMTKSEFDASAL
uniref:GNAT family N-acetyltransferase n=1 Tax=Thaumasiovibrio occultus TaxID=1891184 RepID=UPI000B3600C8|nr:GNAT family protein [Thaumasiovibrio occultus]